LSDMLEGSGMFGESLMERLVAYVDWVDAIVAEDRVAVWQ
jgi:hypothetical protein